MMHGQTQIKGFYKFENNTYPWRIRRRSNLGYIFRVKSASYGPGNTGYPRKLVQKCEVTVLHTLWYAGWGCSTMTVNFTPIVNLSPYWAVGKNKLIVYCNQVNCYVVRSVNVRCTNCIAVRPRPCEYWTQREGTQHSQSQWILPGYTGCFTALGYNCRRWFPRYLWWKKFI